MKVALLSVILCAFAIYVDTAVTLPDFMEGVYGLIFNFAADGWFWKKHFLQALELHDDNFF